MNAIHKMQKYPFEYWYVDCMMAGIENPRCPDDYLWDLDDCEEWIVLYNIGLSPKEAVSSVFCKH
ncbi:MAG TPA: hypothetical protein VFM18_00460 [Methanosarcina sp.]|nr:hypothetical protein [Methanosarcina sp.]